MGMAQPPLEPKWDAKYTEKAAMVYVHYASSTAAHGTVMFPAPSLTVCKVCRRSRALCRCSWRRQ